MALLDCGHEPSPHSDFTTGYGLDAEGKRYCYSCCADRERKRMVETGKATLYLTIDKGAHYTYAVTDWPGLLSFPARYVRRGTHNIARTRLDFEFTGPDGYRWVGVQYGADTQIAHCRRTKQAVAS